MAGRLVNDCPACTKFILNGGRKRGNKDPNITEVGKLVEEQTVLDQLHALERAFSMLSQGDASEAAEWDGKKVFGWTPSELLEMSSKKV